MFTSLSAQSQFSQAIGNPGTDFRTSQIRTLGGNTYISGWLTDPNATAPTLSTEGILIRLDTTGDIDWIYKLSSDNQVGISIGTRIHDFDFDDAQDHIVFVGATANTNGGIIDNQSIIGMVDMTTGVGVFQESYNFRMSARESFQRIENHPGIGNANNYLLSGNINDVNTGPGTIDNYIAASINITNGNVGFNWIQENGYLAAPMDDEMSTMRVLDVAGTPEVVYAGTSLPNLAARINFHDINAGFMLREFSFNLSGFVMDMTQIGNTMIVVGQLFGPARAFIASVELPSGNVTSSLQFANLNNFSRVTIDATTGDILAVGEQIGGNPAICRLELNGNQLSYIDASIQNFGTNSVGNGLLVTDGNNAFMADTRLNLASFATNQAVAVIHTDLSFFSCDTINPIFTPQPANLILNLVNGLDEDILMVPNPMTLTPLLDTLCVVSLCGNGFNLNTLLPVFHGSRSHYVNVADIDNDGWMDFAVPDIGFAGTPRFSISENIQNLTFVNTPSTFINPLFDREGLSMQFIDLDNGAGHLDLVVLRFATAEVFIESNGTGTYSLQQTIPLTPFALNDPSNTIGIYRGDFEFVDHTNDGIPDLVVTGPETGGNPLDRIAIFRGTGNLTAPFFSLNLITTLEGRESIKYWQTLHNDIDGDGFNDLLMGQADYNQASQSIFGYINNGNITPNPPFVGSPQLSYETPTGLFWPRGMALEDIDNSTQNDLIVAMQSAGLNNGIPTGQGALMIARDIPTAAGTYTVANLQWEILNIPGQPVGVAVGDIDGDNNPEIVVAVHNEPNAPIASFVRIYENDGTGNFFNFVDINTPIGRTIELQIADFNNDCCMDIVTTQWIGAMSYVLINDCETTEFTIKGQVVCENDPCDFLFATGGVPNQTVEITDGTTTYVAITDGNGNYQINVPAGTYDIGVANVNYGNPGCLNANTADVIGFQPANNINSVNFFIEDECILDVTMVGGLSGFAGANTCPFEATPCDSLIWEYCFEIENNTCSDQLIDEILINLPHGIIISNVVINPLVHCVSQTLVPAPTPTISTLNGSFLFGSTVDYNINSTLTIPSGGCFSACVEATFTGNFTLPVTAEIDVQYSCGGAPGPSTTSGVAYQDTCSCDPNLKLATSHRTAAA